MLRPIRERLTDPVKGFGAMPNSTDSAVHLVLDANSFPLANFRRLVLTITAKCNLFPAIRRSGFVYPMLLLCIMVNILVSAERVSFAEQQGQATAPEKSKPALVINAEVSLGHHSKSHAVDLGELPSDRPVELALRIINDSAEIMVYDKVEVSCACIRATLDHGVIEPGKESVCRVLLDLTQKQRSQLFHVPVKLANSEKSVDFSVIHLRGYLQGHLGFSEPYFTSELSRGEDVTELTVPFIATPPIAGDLVQVELAPSIASYRIEPASGKKDTWNLLLKVRSHDVPKEGLAVSLTLDDYATDRSANGVLMLRHDRAVSISPRSIRLAKDEGGEQFSGSCILTVRTSASTGPSDEVRPVAAQRISTPVSVPIVSASINGKTITTDVRSMNDEHFRVSVRISAALVDELTTDDASRTLEIDWTVSTKRGAFQFSTPFVVTL